MTFSERIRNLRIDYKLTQKELADKINSSASKIGMWEAGKRDPGTDDLIILCEIFNVSTDYLLGNTDIKRPYQIPTRKKGVKIPVLGRVAAGVPVEAIEDIEDYEEITPEMAAKGDYFALKIHGTSMEPKFSEGDVVIVRKQSDLESGNIGVIIVNGSDATVKKVIKQENGIMLIATNQSVFPPQFYDNKTVNELPITILGRVVELRAKF